MLICTFANGKPPANVQSTLAAFGGRALRFTQKSRRIVANKTPPRLVVNVESHEQLDRWHGIARAHGFSTSAYIRRFFEGKSRLGPSAHQQLKELTRPQLAQGRDLSGMGNNLNQLTRAVHSQHPQALLELPALLARISEELKQTRASHREILEALDALRRGDA